jgi:hypothetical protein
MRVSLLGFPGVLLLCLGCGKGPAADPWLQGPPQAVHPQTANNLASFGLREGAPEDRIAAAAQGKRARKLVYNAEVDMVVEDLGTAEQELDKLLQAHEAAVANSETVSRAGAPRTSLWRLRVPVAQFDAFLKVLESLGELHRSRRDVQDVTRSHSELEEQIRNMTAEVAGLRTLLQKPTDKLADTLAVREQLSKVTREMEALKGRLQRMQAQAEYSTVTLRLLERSGHTLADSASLGTAAARALGESWDAFVGFARAALLFLVKLGPWLPLPAVAAGIGIWRWRRRATRFATR